jgi:hypothetical protein
MPASASPLRDEARDLPAMSGIVHRVGRVGSDVGHGQAAAAQPVANRRLQGHARVVGADRHPATSATGASPWRHPVGDAPQHRDPAIAQRVEGQRRDVPARGSGAPCAHLEDRASASVMMSNCFMRA